MRKKKLDWKKLGIQVHSLRRALMVSWILLCCAMITVLLYYIFGVVHVTRKQAEESFHRIITASQERIEHILSSSLESAQMASYSSAVQKYLLSETPGIVIDSRSSVSDIMTYISTFGDGFQDIELLSDRERKVSITNSYTDLVEMALEVSGIEDRHGFKKPFFTSDLYYQGEKYILYLFPVYGTIDGYRYKYNPIVCGIVYKLSDIMNNLILSGYEGSATVLLQEGKLLESSRKLSDAEHEVLGQLEAGQSTKKIGGERYFVSRTSIDGSDWELVYLTPEQAITASFDQMRNIMVMMIMASILLVSVLMLTILLAVRKDIGGMTEDIRRIGAGEGQVRTPAIAELQPVSAVINSTMADLHESTRREQKLIADSYEARLSQIRAEMLAYRSQINPHFLFNTLESVRSLAHRYGAQPVEQLVGGMSQMFRYSLYSPMIVPLEEELGHLGSYFSVMETRFPGRYRILEQIDPDTLSWPTVSMLLQPLAENAMLHAFSGRRSGMILVQTFIKDDRLVVRIADNGVGMSEELLDAIVQKMKNTSGETAHIDGHSDQGPEHKFSIGLPNIYRRLKLTFGEHAHLVLRSKEGYYTVAELWIPKEKQGDSK